MLVEFPHKWESEPFDIREILSPGKTTIPQEDNQNYVCGMVAAMPIQAEAGMKSFRS